MTDPFSQIERSPVPTTDSPLHEEDWAPQTWKETNTAAGLVTTGMHFFKFLGQPHREGHRDFSQPPLVSPRRQEDLIGGRGLVKPVLIIRAYCTRQAPWECRCRMDNVVGRCSATCVIDGDPLVMRWCKRAIGTAAVVTVNVVMVGAMDASGFRWKIGMRASSKMYATPSSGRICDHAPASRQITLAWLDSKGLPSSLASSSSTVDDNSPGYVRARILTLPLDQT
ncbi:hypothetical protein P691DRAFT_780774 [Macrolepiota fuliginosa MF-IS2]|uniref:Uncharacterized protein n=1 Tax=Macrolepiota fuliginosa MF-IS2 TaxID=1400762 RepID=A0A9P6BVR0_9AGAR|nr:hypothetical protein P691DRAFT_780774 [Macrolepiota fuliginosa MF-IS2]